MNNEQKLREEFVKENLNLFESFVPPELDDSRTETENRILNEQAVKRAVAKANLVVDWWLSKFAAYTAEVDKNIGMLRQWLNEDRIDNPRKMVKNEELKKFLMSSTHQEH